MQQVQQRTASVSVQPLASVAVTVYIPAISPVIEEPEPLLLQAKVYPEVPPDAEAEAAPVLPPLQLTFVVFTETASTEGCDIVVDAVPVHPLLSVTVTVYVPAVNPVAVAEVAPVP